MPLDVDLLRSSFEIVAERQPDLALEFYENLFSRHPDAESLFRRDRESQAKMLTEALVAVLDHLEDAPWLQSTLGQMGVDHLGYGVTEEMYGWVREAMLVTLEEIAGADWTSQLRDVWSEALTAVSGLMVAGAREASH